MSFVRFTCQRNELLEELHSTYKITPLSIPDAKVQPLLAIAHRGQKTQILGPLADFLRNAAPLSGLKIHLGQSVEFSAKKTNNLQAELGLKLLKGFWKAFDPQFKSQGIESALEKSSELSLSFEGVQQRYVFPSTLGTILDQCVLQPASHANMHLFTRAERPMELFVIDSIFECKRFGVNIEKTKVGTAAIDLPPLAESVEANAKLKVSATGSSTLYFESPEFLTFGFSCVHLPFDKRTGKINIGETTIWAKGTFGEGTTETAGIEAVSLMSLEGLGLLEWDEG